MHILTESYVTESNKNQAKFPSNSTFRHLRDQVSETTGVKFVKGVNILPLVYTPRRVCVCLEET